MSTTGDIDFPSRALLTKLLLDPTWNLNESPNNIRIIRDKTNNVFIFPTVLASTRGNSGGTIVTADIGLVPQTATGANGIPPATLGNNGLLTNAILNLFNGVNYDAEMNMLTSRTVSALATQQTVILFLGNLHSHLSILCNAPASTATLDVQGSVDNSNYIDLLSLATAATNTIDLVGDSPMSSTTTIAATNVSNPVTFGGASTQPNNLNPLSFRFLKVVAGAAGAGVATTLTIAVK